MQGVVGGVNARTLTAGGVPNPNPDLLSASTTLLQSGGGAYVRLVNALQGLDQSANIITLANQAVNFGSDIATLQGQVATLQGQVATLQGQVSTLQAQVQTLQQFQASFNYLQAEVSTGTIFLDQRTIYRRSIVINNAVTTPNNNFIFPHGILNISYIVNIQAMASQPASPQYPLTFLNMATAPTFGTGLSIWADPTNIVVSVGTTGLTGYQVIATLFYTATDR